MLSIHFPTELCAVVMTDRHSVHTLLLLCRELGPGVRMWDEGPKWEWNPAPTTASPSACTVAPSVLDGVLNFFLLCFFTMGEGGGSRLRGLRSPDGVQS